MFSTMTGPPQGPGDVLAEDARQRIGRAAGLERHDELDVARGVVLRRGRRGGRRNAEEAGGEKRLHRHGVPLCRSAAGRRGAVSRSTSAAGTGTVAARSRKESDLPWPSRPRLALTPPSSTSSRTKLKAWSLGRS